MKRFSFYILFLYLFVTSVNKNNNVCIVYAANSET